MFPLAVRIGEGQDRVIRAIIGMNEEEQSIIFAGNVPEGSYARMMRGRIEHLIDGVRAAGIASTKNLDSFAPRLSILVSCTGRRYVLKTADGRGDRSRRCYTRRADRSDRILFHGRDRAPCGWWPGRTAQRDHDCHHFRGSLADCQPDV